ncbi:biotin synthase [Elusimicrobium simillimum]|uniref:[FeFe] hydrogenase H-cluster radical SAM maturase HydE n=1 Tax=Elusimicrobium simillimum TaxID=3143438 RepID=UPI003C6F4295
MFDSSKQALIDALSTRHGKAHQLWQRAYNARKEFSGDKIYLRGLVEFSNICAKDCYYCGIRKSNTLVQRYKLEREQVLAAAAEADRRKLGSITLQSGEVCSGEITDFVEDIIKTIKKDFPDLRVVLSCGEQSKETYKTWLKAGANRYLLKIETSNQHLYAKLHPDDNNHSLKHRINCLHTLGELGYQLGSGIMVGLPWQTSAIIAEDILFFKNINIDMCGIGPFVEHAETPLYNNKEELLSYDERLVLTLNTIACIRLSMPDVNIAAATSLDALNPKGKELAVSAGANVIMINLTPGEERPNYALYQRPQESLDKDILSELQKYGETIAYGQGGDSKHFQNKQK